MNKVAKSGHSTDWSAIRFEAESRKAGVVRARSLKFKDGAALHFNEETVLNDDGSIHRPRYSYHYECLENGGNFFFRYDRDPDYAKPILHEECHLHANREDIRYKTHATNFDEVFEFIVAHFYKRTK